jgi:NTE family protein
MRILYALHALALGAAIHLICLPPVQAQDAVPSLATARPRVGLVLGGGGARGAAHVGVLRVIDELKIPIDCVVGTSMGALVGATFAAGTPPADVEREMRAIKWEETVGGQGRRNRMPINRKLSGITYTNSLELGLSNRRLRTPGGLLDTQEIEQALRLLVARAQSVSNFDELPIPFRAIATDMVKGEMAVLDSGELAVAMRASMAAPGAFSPVVIGDQVLADGGLMRNLPVDVARELCADVVIAVWMSSTPPNAEEVSAFSMLQRSVDVSIEANVREQIESLTDADVGIEVELEDMRSTDFQLVPDAIDAGRAAAVTHRDALMRYAVPEEQYAAWAQSVGRTDVETYTLAEVRINGTERVNPDYITAQLRNLKPGATVTADQVAADADRVYQIGDFGRVDYRFVGDSGPQTLEIDVVEGSPNILRGDFGLAAYEAGDLLAIIRLDHERTWINRKGGRWHNAIQMGRDSQLQSDFYQPLTVNQRFFVQPIMFGEQRREDIYLDDDRVAEYKVKQAFGQADLGVNFGTVAQLRFGLRTGWSEGVLDTGIVLPDIERKTDTALQLHALVDTRDAIGIVTHGSFFNARYVEATDWLSGDEDYSLLEAVYARAFEVKRGNSLNFILGGADTLDGQLPISQEIELGGIRTFPGLRPGELRGDEYWFAGTAYYWRLFDIVPLFGNALYAGVRFQGGRMKNRLDVGNQDTLLGLSGSVGGRTPIGPFLLALGFVDNGSWQIQFTLGRPLNEGSMLDELY